MKYLLTIALAIGLSNAAYSACSKSAPNECTTESECTNLSEENGQKFVFNASSKESKCMVVATEGTQKCDAIADKARAANEAKILPKGSDKPAEVVRTKDR